MSSVQQKMVVMFADVPGSASLFEKLRDSEALHALDRCLKRMIRSVEGYAGRVIQSGSDELLVLFESAEEACHAAIEMQQRIADLPPIGGLKLGLRIGLHSGEVTEENGQASGEAVRTAARIGGSARQDQILCSSMMLAELSQLTSVAVEAVPNVDALRDGNIELDLRLVSWPKPQAAPESLASTASQQATKAAPSGRLCVRYRGKAFLLDEKTPVLTIGRDVSNKLVIEDPKASRQHARLEKRADGYYLVDSSTNGTFVALVGAREVILRHAEILFNTNGRIAFGTSNNDPAADIADFEYL